MFKLLTCIGHFGHGSKAQFDSRIARCYIHDIYRNIAFVENIFITIKPNFLQKNIPWTNKFDKKKKKKNGERGFKQPSLTPTKACIQAMFCIYISWAPITRPNPISRKKPG